ncbi:unnamed protein product [Rotaria sordida]|uniref:NYN domain-containing protein n=1 Tax=Rotaria sordida TaxID=392033 RepID=A0A819QLR5_9BILA|nr:unnamed protein product [Rotaria sordida]
MLSPLKKKTKFSKLSYNIHIVVDNSNLFIGAQLGQGINGQQDAAIRINVGNLVQIIEENKNLQDIKTRIVGGSTPPRTSRVWDEWEKCNYKCLLGDRSMFNKEVFLDDMLHSQIQNLILKNLSHRGNIQQILILISGDGNANNNRTSFPDIVTIALEHGWTVELWSWKASLSTKFSAIQRKYPSKMKIKHLDPYRSKITFKQQSQQKQQQPVNHIQYGIFSALIFLICISLFVYYFNIL